MWNQVVKMQPESGSRCSKRRLLKGKRLRHLPRQGGFGDALVEVPKSCQRATQKQEFTLGWSLLQCVGSRDWELFLFLVTSGGARSLNDPLNLGPIVGIILMDLAHLVGLPREESFDEVCFGWDDERLAMSYLWSLHQSVYWVLGRAQASPSVLFAKPLSSVVDLMTKDDNSTSLSCHPSRCASLYSYRTLGVLCSALAVLVHTA
jgi:hypothetical protein